jgi:drug/metabolite transporter (DMT)-like permease
VTARPADPRIAIVWALAAAALFGLSAPATKALVRETDPWLLAGLLYAGAGISLGVVLLGRTLMREPPSREAPITGRDWPWLGAAIAAGGVAGPVLLAFGLAWGSAAAAALLLNLEAVFTALLARLVFREHLGPRIAAGVVVVSAGAVLLAWSPGESLRLSWSGLLVAGACLAWAVDNNLTRQVSAANPVQIVALKGLLAGATNVAIALAGGARLPLARTVVAALAVGALGYGLSLVLYILALRHLGAGRTAGYFSTAPFLGAVGAILGLGEPLTAAAVVAGVLMGVGVWLHLAERHAHLHEHDATAHAHRHRHDPHHQHEHEPGEPVREPHSHWHVHAPVRHGHAHWPDLHHRHTH